MNNDTELIISQYLKEKKDLQLFDINMWIGPPLERTFHFDQSLPFLKEIARKDEIRGGIISHTMGYHYDAYEGNQALLEEVKGSSFWKCITVTPDMFFNLQSGHSYLENQIQKGARMARIFPKKNNFDFSPWCSGELVEGLLAYHLPLMVWQTEIQWNDIHEICSAFPGLKLIIEGNPQKILYHNRRYFQLLKLHKNIKLELHNLIGYKAVESVVKEFGADRILFGSYLPYWDPNVAAMLLCGTELSKEEKLLIAHQNALSMIKEVVSE